MIRTIIILYTSFNSSQDFETLLFSLPFVQSSPRGSRQEQSWRGPHCREIQCWPGERRRGRWGWGNHPLGDWGHSTWGTGRTSGPHGTPATPENIKYQCVSSGIFQGATMKLALDLISECHQLAFAFSIQKISSTLHLYTQTQTHTHTE